jgi:arginine decarboxylase
MPLLPVPRASFTASARCADVRGLAGACHERGLPLVTDDAWGLDYAFAEHPGALVASGGFVEGAADQTLRTLRVVR